MTRRIATIFLLFYAVFPAFAQFYTSGSDRGSRKWSRIETQEYRLIYPSGLDSLARAYALELERWRTPAGDGLGWTPNCSYRRKMPVILHTGTAYSNGSVTWTPRRMDLLTLPSPYNPDPLEWCTQLVLHESRHVAQMQTARQGVFKPLHWFIGELSEGAAAAIYSGPAFFEGDAVVAETALTDAGRGRFADFLDYYRAAFREGDMRDWWQWRYGSQRWYCPDYYRAGYSLIAGMRTVFDAPDFTERYYRRIQSKVLPFCNLQKTVKDVSGLKFNDAFREIQKSMMADWAENDRTRAPFTEGTRVTADTKRFVSYDGIAAADSCIYAIRSGIQEARTLVRITADGKIRRLGAFAGETSALKWDGERLWWTEFRQDPRWELESESVLRYIDSKGKRHTLAKNGRYYNPAPDGEKVAVVEYTERGGSAIVVFGLDGKRLETIPMPDGERAVEPVWCDGELYASCIMAHGSGIVRVHGNVCMTTPEQVKINHLFSHGGKIHYTCDRNGVQELYALCPADGSVVQVSSTEAGGDEYQFMGGKLYYTSLGRDGRAIYSIAENALQPRVPGILYRNPMAEKLSAQSCGPGESNAVISEPARYSKLANLIHVHSWAPLYLDYDEIEDMSKESISQGAGLGATVFFQNSLGDFYGSAGYSAWNPEEGWKHGGHASLTWRGWYPVFEAKAHVYDRGQLRYSMADDPDRPGVKKLSTAAGGVLAEGQLRTYVPLNLSSGGWVRGVIPSVRMDFTNNCFLRDGGGKSNMSLLNTSLRAYTMRPVPSSGIYPRLGIGLEGGYRFRPFVSDLFLPYAYGYAYGYLPGFMRTHGIKLTGLVSKYLSNKNMPTTSFSVDYALPFIPLDWSGLSPLAYVRNFELVAHYDVGSLTSSVGGSFAVRLENLAWIPYTTRIGINFRHSIFGLNESNVLELLFEIDL